MPRNKEEWDEYSGKLKLDKVSFKTAGMPWPILLSISCNYFYLYMAGDKLKFILANFFTIFSHFFYCFINLKHNLSF